MNLVGKGSGYGKEPRSRLLGMVLGDLRDQVGGASDGVVRPGQQHRRDGIIAATCPTIRVRITDPTSAVGIADAKPMSGAAEVSKVAGGRAIGAQTSTPT